VPLRRRAGAERHRVAPAIIERELELAAQDPHPHDDRARERWPEPGGIEQEPTREADPIPGVTQPQTLAVHDTVSARGEEGLPPSAP